MKVILWNGLRGVVSQPKKCEDALRQIDDRQYADELLDDGYNSIIKYGICFYKKHCKIKCCKN